MKSSKKDHGPQPRDSSAGSKPASASGFVLLNQINPKQGGIAVLGRFVILSGRFLVSDNPPTAKMLKHHPQDGDFYACFAAMQGVWEAFVKFTPQSAGAPAALVVRHWECKFHPDQVVQLQTIARVTVEAGRLAIVDYDKAQEPDIAEAFANRPTESVIKGCGCISRSGAGGGTYPLRGLRVNGEVVALAACFEK